MKKRVKLQNKILVVMLIICFIPFLSFSVYVYDNFSKNLQRNTEQDAFNNVKKYDKLVFYNIWLTENTINYVVRDREFCRIITEHGTNDEFNGYITKAIEQSPLVKGVVVFLNDGVYSYGYKPEADDKVEFALLSRKGQNDTARIKWGGRKNDCMIVGTDIYNPDDENNRIGTMYFLMSDEIFADISDDKEGIVFVCDTIGNVIISNNEAIPSGSNIWTGSIEINDFVYTDDNGSKEVEFGGNNYLAVKYMSQFTDWYFVKLLDESIFMKDVTFVQLVSLFVGLTALAAIFFLYTFIIRKMFKPFKKINNAMRNVVADDFNVSLDIHTNDEFETIGEGFNKMVAEIDNLLIDIKKSNEDRMRLEIEALQYQIDPHFLYNILAAVRFIALKNGSREISDMLLKLNRLFRIKLKDAGKDSTLENDMNVMMDYTELWNLRYDNKIEFSFEIDENSKQCMIPTFILQPIVENAITHGASSRVLKNEPAVVRIKTEYRDGCLELKVYDNGLGMDEKTKSEILNGTYTGESGIGWTNVRKRLWYRYKDGAEVDILTQAGKYTEVIIRIYE